MKHVAPLFLLALLACRDSTVSVAPSAMLPILPSTEAASGCIGPDQTFTVGQTASAIPLATLAIGPFSQVTAARGSELLFATGANATVVAIDLSGPGVVETELVSAGTVAALYAQPAIGISDPPVLSGLTVLDATSLLVIEHTANVILRVDRTTPDTVTLWAGLPSTVPGFADGFALQVGTEPLRWARSASGARCQPVGTGREAAAVFVADSGNHALRRIRGAAQVETIAGSGTPFFGEGELGDTFFDTPAGLAIACNDSLYLTEAGGAVAGNRVRRLSVGAPNFFGFSGFQGDSQTLVGDGTETTSGGAAGVALAARPYSPVATSAGDVYWVDLESGVLRRLRDDVADCPLHSDCIAAVLSPDFTPGGLTSLVQTTSGVLYALDAAAGALLRVTP